MKYQHPMQDRMLDRPHVIFHIKLSSCKWRFIVFTWYARLFVYITWQIIYNNVKSGWGMNQINLSIPISDNNCMILSFTFPSQDFCDFLLLCSTLALRHLIYLPLSIPTYLYPYIHPTIICGPQGHHSYLQLSKAVSSIPDLQLNLAPGRRA